MWRSAQTRSGVALGDAGVQAGVGREPVEDLERDIHEHERADAALAKRFHWKAPPAARVALHVTGASFGRDSRPGDLGASRASAVATPPPVAGSGTTWYPGRASER